MTFALIALGIAGVLGVATGAGAQAPRIAARVGDFYEITMTRESSQTEDGGSSGSSHDRDTMTERVTALRTDGLELEYDLPAETPKEERELSWQFPARIFRPRNGPDQLVNRTELEIRRDAWLKRAKLPLTVCGHWVFTWNAFHIDCDPQSVVAAIRVFEIASTDVREGARYQMAGALDAGAVLRRGPASQTHTFHVDMAVDPDAARHARAESDVALGEIMKKPVTLESALRGRAKEAVSGTISVTFTTDPAGTVLSRTKVTNLKVTSPSGHSESQMTTETVDRRRRSQLR